ncbi:hypothetical protein [Flavobacterium sp.]|uniref:hypothetical protein n=1 Tax=Flavobacterium sp. TaxID=239 RepID=UPI002616F8AE|nr:hypothetical protein [Flavobacterium sp.]
MSSFCLYRIEVLHYRRKKTITEEKTLLQKCNRQLQTCSRPLQKKKHYYRSAVDNYRHTVDRYRRKNAVTEVQ